MPPRTPAPLPRIPAGYDLGSPDYVARAEAEATRPSTATANSPEDEDRGGTASPAGGDAAAKGGDAPALRIQCSTSSRRASPDVYTPSKLRKAGRGKGQSQQQPSQRRSQVGPPCAPTCPQTCKCLAASAASLNTAV